MIWLLDSLLAGWLLSSMSGPLGVSLKVCVATLSGNNKKANVL